MQLHHYFMLIGGIISPVTFVLAILAFMAMLGSNSREGVNWFIASFILFIIFVISGGFALFGFIDYLKN